MRAGREIGREAVKKPHLNCKWGGQGRAHCETHLSFEETGEEDVIRTEEQMQRP